MGAETEIALRIFKEKHLRTEIETRLVNILYMKQCLQHSLVTRSAHLHRIHRQHERALLGNGIHVAAV